MTAATIPRARAAIALIFLMHGFITGAWVPHIPLAQQRLDLDLASFGLALLALAAGAVAAMPVSAMLANRYGSARVTFITGLLYGLALVLPASAPEPVTFVAGLALFGSAMGAMDVAMNAQGLAIEKAMGRPLMSLFHGMYSVGAMSGAGASALILASLPAAAHLALSVLLVVSLILIAGPRLLPADADRGLEGEQFFALPSRATIGLGALCFMAPMSEGAVLDWSAIQLKQAFDLPAHRSVLGYALFAGGMALARFAGDHLRSRFGSVSVVRVSALSLTIAMIVALTAPHPVISILAYGIAGTGIGNLAPILFGGGGRLEPSAPGRGIAAVVALGYAGFVAGPPFIGFLGEAIGLSAALGVVVAGAVIIALSARLAAAADS
jgi:MFS family permease